MNKPFCTSSASIFTTARSPRRAKHARGVSLKKGNHLLLEGAKRETEDRIVPRSVEADDSEVEINNDDESDGG